MHFPLIVRINWAAGAALNLGLLVVLVARGRWRQFRLLTFWISFMIARTALLFIAYERSNQPHHQLSGWIFYNWTWTIGTWLDFLIQLGVVLEIAGIVLRPTGTWVRDARLQFAAVGLTAVLVAAGLAWAVSPPAWSTGFAWKMRANLFTSLVICEFFVMMSVTANRLGLGWRNHVIAVGQGLTMWSVVTLISTAFQSWFGSSRYFVGLDHLREFAYMAVIGWIALQLWRQEPERQPISADLREYILALHRRVEYDLGRLDARN